MNQKSTVEEIALSVYWSLGILGAILFLARIFSYQTGIPTGFHLLGFQPYDVLLLFPLVIVVWPRLKALLPRAAWALPAGSGAYLSSKFLRAIVPEEGPADAFSLIFGAVAGLVVALAIIKSKSSTTPLIKRDIPKMEPGPSPLTLDAKGEFVLPSGTVDYHVHVIGGTGTGKTRYVLKPFIYQDIVKNKIGCFIYDVKSNLHSDVAYYAHTAGRLGDLQYFDLAFPERSQTWNPLSTGTADEIANRVYCALYYDSDKASAYYSELASAFLNNLISLMKMEQDTITFHDLYLATSELETFRIINGLCARHKDTLHANFFYQNWLAKPKKQRQEELTGLINKLQRFSNREWSFLLNSRNPEIRLDKIFDQNKILLFGISGQKYPDDVRALSILAMMEISQQVARRAIHKPDKSFRVYLDEFYNMAYSQFINTLNKARESKVDFILAHQAIADLKMISPEFAEQISINTRTKIILTQDDSGTAEFFSQLLGTEEEKHNVYSYDTRESKMLASPAGYTQKEEHRFRFNPNTIKELPLGEAIVRTVFPTGPVMRRIKLPEPVDPPKSFNFKDYLKVSTRKSEPTPTPFENKNAVLADMRKEKAKGPIDINDADQLIAAEQEARKKIKRLKPPKL